MVAVDICKLLRRSAQATGCTAAAKTETWRATLIVRVHWGMGKQTDGEY
jgi:hypothetical protein